MSLPRTRPILKRTLLLLAVVALSVAAYKGAEFAAILRFSDQVETCSNQAKLCEMVKSGAQAESVGAHWKKSLSCMEQRKNWFDRFFFSSDKVDNNPESGRALDAELLQIAIRQCGGMPHGA